MIFRPYSSKELRLFPLNTVTSAPPAKGLTTRDLNLGSEGSESDSASSSSDSSSDSDSDSDSEAEHKKSQKAEKPKPQPFKVELKPRKKVDEIKPFATCKHCSGKLEKVYFSRKEVKYSSREQFQKLSEIPIMCLLCCLVQET